uniref:RIPOR family member 3 n=1 Tax=Amphilophus citrinellus TaxID=61819 RepID=A0A3Q0RJH6_AMPCI
MGGNKNCHIVWREFPSPTDGQTVNAPQTFRCCLTSSVRNSLRVKAMTGSKSSRAPASPRRGSGAIWSLQPEQVDRVFQALRKGLKDYLEGHQAEMDFLSSQQRETKRNSRLVRSKKRRSRVSNCQRKPNKDLSFFSQDSPLPVFTFLLQDMSAMEGELEILLGELHIKMKGLIGFARLCPGDQYEVLVRLGRQRWKIRGRIESDDTQSWDEEEMVFLPHIHHNFEIKVTEAKGLGWLLVGMVTCASADFFVARPQVMLVDITELGTIKLQLEVTWNPFDSTEKLRPLPTNKQSVSSRKSSVYSWTAPSTPSFTEKYFIVSKCACTNTHTHTHTHTHLHALRDDAKHMVLVAGLHHLFYVSSFSLFVSFQNDLSMLRSSSSQETLVVEEVLGSFDFLSNDLNADDDASCLGSLRLKDSGISSFQQSIQRSHGLLSEGSQSASEEELVITPLTSGNWGLDQALETHLDICCILLRELLEEMSLQAEVLDRISCLLLEKNDSISARDILPKAQRTRDLLLFWEECVNDSSSPFCCHIDSFTRTLKKRYTHRVKAKQPGQSEKVFSQLLQQVQAACRVVPSSQTVCSPERVTLFQLSVYLKRWNFQELGENISRLSKEEYILLALRSPKRRRALNKLRGRRITELLPLGCTLQTLASLQIDSNHKVCKAAANCICRAAGCKAFRTKAVLYYTESLKSTDIKIQQGSCLALKCLRATESVDHIADLWRSTDEDLRSAARETVLSFGKKGYQAYQRMDQLDTEMQEEAYQNQETEITIL